MIAGIYGMNFDHMPELHWDVRLPVRARRHGGRLRGPLPGVQAQRLACSRGSTRRPGWTGEHPVRLGARVDRAGVDPLRPSRRRTWHEVASGRARNPAAAGAVRSSGTAVPLDGHRELLAPAGRVALTRRPAGDVPDRTDSGDEPK